MLDPKDGSPPRVRGKDRRTVYRWHEQGSPPRVRGKGPALSARADALGVTPACAGKRAPVRIGRCAGKGHPRVCGEKYTVYIW